MLFIARRSNQFASCDTILASVNAMHVRKNCRLVGWFAARAEIDDISVLHPTSYDAVLVENLPRRQIVISRTLPFECSEESSKNTE